MSKAWSRREFLGQVARAGSVAPFASVLRAEQTQATPNERLNVGVVGVAGRAASNLAGVARENVVAICDVDEDRMGAARKAFPLAKVYRDYRKMLDDDGLDAVVVSTPDHTHAIPAARALRMGKHVYCEKPMAHSVHEARAMTDAAKAHGVRTQLGTQIHAGGNYRRVVEIVRNGAIGPVKRVHVWFGGRPKPGVRVVKGTPPKGLDYDLWLGPAPYRPYDESHAAFNWRYWWDFGNGTLGDFGCHYMDLPFWALDLKYPSSVQSHGVKDYAGENQVPGKQQVDYRFPARGELPPVHMTWYHGGYKPPVAAKFGKGSAVLFVGTKGELIADYGSHKLYPEEKFRELKVEKSIPDSVGHHLEWLEAIRSGKPSTCDFSYSGPLSEAVLLGNVSYRAGGIPIDWDAESLTATGTPEATALLRREYRKGWSL